jgi:hypothetical protein
MNYFQVDKTKINFSMAKVTLASVCYPGIPTVNADLTNLPQLYGTVFFKTFDMCNHLAFSKNFFLSIKVKVAIRVKNKLKIQNNDESLQVSRKCQVIVHVQK